MLTYQKNKLLALLAQFEAQLYNSQEYEKEHHGWRSDTYNTIDRNIQSIRKQIKKL